MCVYPQVAGNCQHGPVKMVLPLVAITHATCRALTGAILGNMLHVGHDVHGNENTIMGSALAW